MDIISESMCLLSDYCIQTCKAQCCKKGKIIINLSKASLFKRGVITHPQIEERKDGYYELNLSPHCPNLGIDFKCTIYNTPYKPEICSEYPLFIKGKTIFASTACPAVTNKLINFKILEDAGFIIVLQ